MADDSVLLGELAEEFSRRVREGQMPDIEEYAKAHPTLAERIRELFPTLMFLEGMAGAKTGAAERPEIAPGSVFGNYRIERELGRGGMGVVYEAVHLALEKRVAMKVLLIRGSREAGHLERFFREAKTAAALHHTNIVPVFDVGQVGGIPYYAMQYIEGRGLDVVLRELQASGAKQPAFTWKPDQSTIMTTEPREPAGADGESETPPEPQPSAAAMSPEFFRWAGEIGIQAAEGLAYAHQRGVTHRDIKPSNLILDQQGILWITDFGLARRKDDPSLTQSGALLGTPRYMSPEQAAAAKKPIDHRTDIYSLGATLYELLTRRPAFDGPTPTDVVLQILDREPVAPRRLNPAVPRDLETIVLKAMAKRPEDRYQGAAELAADFRRWLRLEPIHARRIGPVGRMVRWAQRNPQLAAVTATAAAVILLLSGVYVQSLRQENEKTRAALELEEVARQQAEAAEQQAKTSAQQAKSAEQQANDARDTARKNLDESLDNLAMSLYQQARAVRASGQTGRRREALDSLGRAEKLLDRPGRANYAGTPQDAKSSSPIVEKLPTKTQLRNEAVEALLTQDALLVRKFEVAPLLNPTVSADGRVGISWCAEPSFLKINFVVRLIDLTTGKELEKFNRSEMVSPSMAISPDARLLASDTATASFKKLESTGINLWEIPAGRLVSKLQWPDTSLRGRSHQASSLLAFSPTGRHLVAVRTGEKTVEIVLWEVKSGNGKVIAAVDRSICDCAAFSPDGKMLAFPSGEKNITLFSVPDQKSSDIALPLLFAGALAFRPNSQQLAVACTSAIVFWDLAKKHAIGQLEIANGILKPLLAFNKQGTRLALGHLHGDIRVIDPGEQKELVRIERAHSIGLGLLTWRPDGRLVSGAMDGYLKHWELSGASLFSPGTAGADGIAALNYSPDDKWLAVAAPGSNRACEIRFINRRTGAIEQRISVPTPISMSLRCSADSQLVAFIDLSGKKAIVWEASSGKEIARFESKEDFRKDHWISTAFGPDGRLLLVRKQTGKGPAVWDVNSGKLMWQAPGELFERDAYLSPDGRLMVSISPSMFEYGGLTISLWSIPAGKKLQHWEHPHAHAVPSVGIWDDPVKFSPDSQWLTMKYMTVNLSALTGSFKPGPQLGYRIAVWKLSAPKDKCLDIQNPDLPTSYTFTPDSRALVIGYGDGSLHLWDLAKAEEILRFKPCSHGVNRLAFSPDGAFLACAEEQTPGIQVLHLAELRNELAKIGLDW
jgi:serine/threonine protein kinase/WD40 repeat protein